MFTDLKGVVNGKTAAAGILLGALFSLAQAHEMGYIPFELPNMVNTVLSGLGGFLLFFGWYDSAQQEFEKFTDKLKAFAATSPFFGGVIAFFAYVTDNIEAVNLPPVLNGVMLLVGGFLMLFGLKGNGVRARNNMNPTTLSFRNKYRGV